MGLDKYAAIDSVIHRWEQRSKLVALLALIFAFAFTNRLIVLPAMIGVTTILFALSKLPLSFLIRRLRYPGLFILAVVVLLPFATGETVVLSVGPLAVTKEGLTAVLLIAARFFCILTVSLVLFGTAPFMITIQALRSLRLPPIIADMTLLAYRYLDEFGQVRTTMQRAMQLRGFEDRFSLRSLRILAGLAGSLLIRSYERSEQVYQAMRLRGYGGAKATGYNNFAPDVSEADRNSQIAFWTVLLTATAFVAAQVFL